MRNVFYLCVFIFFVLSCVKDTDNAYIPDIEAEEQNTTTFATKGNVNVTAYRNNPEYFDINKDGIDDIKLTMNYATVFMEDCDPIDENDTTSCLPWDEYIVEIEPLGDCSIADTIDRSFVLIRDSAPTSFNELNWVNESRSIVIAPFLDVGEPCTSWMCDIEEGYVPVRIKEDTVFDYGWIKLDIEHQVYISITQYAYGIN